MEDYFHLKPIQKLANLMPNFQQSIILKFLRFMGDYFHLKPIQKSQKLVNLKISLQFHKKFIILTVIHYLLNFIQYLFQFVRNYRLHLTKRCYPEAVLDRCKLFQQRQV